MKISPLNRTLPFDEIDLAVEPAADSTTPRKRLKQAPLPLRLTRRNGMVVDWDTNKIEVAVRKAFLALEMDSDPAVAVAAQVEERVRALGKAVVDI